MKGPPRSILFIGWLFIVTGIFGFAYHVTEFEIRSPFDYDLLWVLLVRILAIVGGVLLLRGFSWARWLVLAWIAYHVVLSAMHDWTDFVVHSAILVAIAFVLLQPNVSAYFRGSGDSHSRGETT